MIRMAPVASLRSLSRQILDSFQTEVLARRSGGI